MAPLRNVVRIEEASEELGRVCRDFGAWDERRRGADRRGQHATQLDTLARTLTTSLKLVGAELAAVSAAEPTGEVYRRCRLNERRAAFLRRYWEYFAGKWDQRDDPALRALLASADEIVWSCWAQAYAGAQEAPGASPLSYVEPHFTPRAIPRVTPPPDIRLADALLQEAIRVLPIPLLGIPPMCVSGPWWLIHLAHETGHHVHYELGAGRLRTGFADAIEEAAVLAGADPELWVGFSEEVFADAFAVLMTGPAAARAVGELVEGPQDELLLSTTRYPAPVIRIALMIEVLRHAGLGPREGELVLELPALGEPGDEQGRMRVEDVERTLQAVPEIASRVLDSPASPLRLSGWRAARYTPAGEARYWRDQFLGESEPRPEQDLRAARMAIAGALSAWTLLGGVNDDDARAAARARLRDRVTGLLPDCAPPGRRAADDESAPDVRAAERALTDAIFGAGLEAIAVAG